MSYLVTHVSYQRDALVVRDTSNNTGGIVPVPHDRVVPLTIGVKGYIGQHRCLEVRYGHLSYLRQASYLHTSISHSIANE